MELIRSNLEQNVINHHKIIMQIGKYLTLAALVVSCAVKKTAAQTGGVPEKAKKVMGEAMQAYDKEDKDKALSLADKAIKAYPGYADAYALKAAIYEERKQNDKADEAYQMSLKGDSFYIPTYYFYSKFLSSTEKYTEAIKVLDLAEVNKTRNQKRPVSPKLNADLKNLRAACEINLADKTSLNSLKIENMGPSINTPAFEYWPGMSIDGNYFIYTYMSERQDQEDFYFSEKTNNTWSKAKPLPGSINTPENEGTSAVRPDGKLIIFTACNQGDGYGSCDLYYSYTNGINWSKRMNLGDKINTTSWDAQPTLGPDGKTLIFASGRPGGFGGKDLYISKFENGAWSTPKNLGPEINTLYDEQSPFLHYDGHTLYFSSNGHGGFGGMDIVFSKMQDDGSWSKPVNIGKYINTENDESGLYVERTGEKAYFASDREGGFGNIDIWQFVLPKEKRPDPVTWIQGEVLDAETGKPVSAEIELFNLSAGKSRLKDASNSFFIPVPPNQNFAFIVSKPGYLFYSQNFQPTNGSLDTPYRVVAKLKPIKENTDIVLNNVFFDVDKFDIKQESNEELMSVVELLKKNPTLKIEISGHTDNTGSAEHNKTLSANRAKSILDFLVIHGIAKERLSSMGYGSSKPVADNATEAGKAMNRRIEMKVLKL